MDVSPFFPIFDTSEFILEEILKLNVYVWYKPISYFENVRFHWNILSHFGECKPPFAKCRFCSSLGIFFGVGGRGRELLVRLLFSLLLARSFLTRWLPSVELRKMRRMNQSLNINAILIAAFVGGRLSRFIGKCLLIFNLI